MCLKQQYEYMYLIIFVLLYLYMMILCHLIIGPNSYFSPVDCTWNCFSYFYLTLNKCYKYTYSSFPRKDVSLQATSLVRTSEETLTVEDVFGCWSKKGFQPVGAVTGVKVWSELMDVRSVLRSNDVQEESEEAEGLVSTFSSCNPSPRFIVQEWKWRGRVLDEGE